MIDSHFKNHNWISELMVTGTLTLRRLLSSHRIITVIHVSIYLLGTFALYKTLFVKNTVHTLKY